MTNLANNTNDSKQIPANAPTPHSDTKDNREIEDLLGEIRRCISIDVKENTDCYVDGSCSVVIDMPKIAQFIQSHTSHLLDTLLEAMPEKKQMAFVKEMRSKGKMNDENRCRYYRYGGHDFAIDQITTIIKEMRK